MNLKNSSSRVMDIENRSCVLPVNFSDSLQTEENFVWVEPKDPISRSVISSDEQRDSEGVFSQCIDEPQHEQRTYTDNTLMSDFVDDGSYDYDVDQYDSLIGNWGCPKKNSNKEKVNLKRITTSKTINRPQEEKVFNINIFDEATAQILKSVVASKNYYTGNFGNIITKKQNSIVVYAYISKKAYPTWEPGGKPVLMYAFINNEYNKRHRNWKREENVVKVYKLCEEEIKNNQIFQQVQKEKEHLRLLKKAKCNVPELRRCARNVIVMGFVGNNGVPAPTIDMLSGNIVKHSTEMYHTIVKQIEMWYKTLHLVHGQLSSKNILFWDKEVYYIGWSHSIRTEHPLALKKLMKDCRFITKFFETRGVPVLHTEKLFKNITGLKDIDDSVLSIINSKVSKDLWKSQHLRNPNRMPCSHTISPRRSCWLK